MPRTGGVYNAPAGTKGIPNTTIQSAPYNALIDDLVQDANAARPITAGGTGATNATDARLNIGALASADLLAAPTKAVPVDNDGVVITDSEDSGKVKRVLWSVIKDRLKAFFDPIYQPILSKVTYLELNGDTTVNADVSIDYHASAGVDFSARLRRISGVNGALEITQTGTGLIDIYGSGGVRIQGATSLTHTLTVDANIFAKQLIAVKAAAADQNSHVYLNDETGATRGIIFATPDKSIRVAVNGGAATSVFTPDGGLTVTGQLKAAGGAVYLNTDGNVYGSRWNSWGSYFAFDAISARIEQRASDYAAAAVAGRVIGDRVTSVGFWDGDGGQPYFTGTPGATRFPCDKSSVDSIGVFAMLAYTGPSTTLGPNQLIGAGELQYANAGAGTGGRPQGTWMLFGHTSGGPSTPGRISVWQRKF